MSWYQLVVFIHVISAVMWVGGILFLGIVAVPAVRRLQSETRSALMSDLGRRFRNVGYTLLGVLVITGVFQSWAHGATVANVLNGTFFATPFGSTLGTKLIYVLLMLCVSVVHDFVVGPASVRAASEGRETESLRKTASWLARLTALLALAVVAYAVMLVR